MNVLKTFGSGILLLLLFLLFVFVRLRYTFSNHVPGQWKLADIWNTDRSSSLVYSDGLGRTDDRDYTLDPITNYCNHPFTTPKGSEGDSPDGFKLRMVHIFIRHGQRTPFDPLPGYHHEEFDCNFQKWYPDHGHNEKFKRFPDSMNHSKEQKQVLKSFEGYSFYPDKDVCGVRSLTSLGTLQLLNLGQFLYDSYISTKHLFDRKLSLTSQMHVRSTDSERTFQSALAFLYGFLPTFNLSELMVTKSDNDFMCVSDVISCTCNLTTHLKDRRDKFVYQQTSNSAHSKIEVPIQSVISANTDKIPYLKGILDYFLSLYCHGKNTPCSNTFPYVCLDYQNLQKLWKGYYKLEKAALNDPDNNDLKYNYLILYPVLTEISNRIEEYIKGESTRKVIVYFGHSTIIRALLKVVGLYYGIRPPIASRFVIELYESTSCEGKERFYIRILYNGQDVSDWMDICQEYDFQSMCEFESFKYSVTAKLYELFETHDYEAACRSDWK